MGKIFSREAPDRATKVAGQYGSMANLNTAGMIDSVVLASTVTPKSGYGFTAARVGVGTPFFDATAVPSTFAGIGATGTRSFFTNESGVMYFVSAAAAPTCDAATRAVAGGAPLN